MNIPSTLIAFLWHFAKKQWGFFAILLVTEIIWSINETSFSYFIKLIVNHLQDYKDSSNQVYYVLAWPIAGLAFIRIMMEIAMRVQGLISISVFPRFRANIRDEIYAYLKEHSLAYFTNNYAGSITNKFSDLPHSSQNVMESFIHTFLPIFLAFIFSIILMAMANYLFAIIILIWFFIHISIAMLYFKTAMKLLETHSESINILNAKMIDSLINILTVHLFARGHHERCYLQDFQNQEIINAKRAMWQLEKMEIMQGIAMIALISSMIFTLIYGWTKGWVSLGDFTLISMLTFNITGHIWYLSHQSILVTKEVGNIKNSLSLISISHSVIDKPNAKTLKITQGNIIFNHVAFSYNKDVKIFTDLNLNIPAKQKVGLVGFSGSGKSTFVNLILRFYDIDSGCITIDEQDISEVTQLSLREQIAMIPQEPALFHRTIIENIRYGRLNANDDEVIAASKLAHSHEFILQLDKGYHTLVGERGGKLSGGQRQRIAIARAILKNAPIFILDEATSSLDSITEKTIENSLSHIINRSTSIVIAHRLSTLLNMDRLLVFDQGKIIEDGSIHDLINKGGYFTKLWDMQVNGFIANSQNNSVPVISD